MVENSKAAGAAADDERRKLRDLVHDFNRAARLCRVFTEASGYADLNRIQLYRDPTSVWEVEVDPCAGSGVADAIAGVFRGEADMLRYEIQQAGRPRLRRWRRRAHLPTDRTWPTSTSTLETTGSSAD